MTRLLFGAALLFSAGSNAASCPNLAGTFLDDTKTYAIKMTQDKCSSIHYRAFDVDKDGNLVEPPQLDVHYETDGKRHPLFPKTTLFFYVATFSATNLKLEPIDVLGAEKCRIFHRIYSIDGNKDLNLEIKYQCRGDKDPREDTFVLKRTVL